MTAMGDGNQDVPGTEKSRLDAELEHATTVDLNTDLDDSKAHLINANGGASVVDHMDVKIVDGTAASSEGEVSFNGLGKDEVLKYADDPFWKRLRWIMFILFLIGWFAMLVTAVLIIALAPRCPPRPDLKWYQKEAIYQVIPESFKDSNEDGFGDFKGLKDKFEHIEDDLGMKAVWLSNIYEIDADGATYPEERGIKNHKAIREKFGASIDEIKKWMKTLRKAGKKVILDLVPNQVSKNHEWFQLSRKGDPAYKDYFIWKKMSNGTMPNNWKNNKEQPAWTFDDERQAYYYSQFGSDYPDLNLSNEAVVKEIKDIMRFWFDSGVSGFHINNVEYLVENPNLPEDDTDKTQTRNYIGTYKLLDELREVADEYSDKPGRERFLFATLSEANKNQTRAYWGEGDKERLHIVIPLMSELKKGCDSNCVYDMVKNLLTDDEEQWLGLSLGNQYSERIATRLDDPGKLNAAHALELLLPGTAINYYGDEFGQLSEGNSMNANRSPMQWNNGPNAGFTSEGVVPWLQIGSKFEKNNLKAGSAHFSGTTPLKGFTDLVELRGKPSFQWGKTKLCAPNENLFMFTRKATRFPYFLTMINMHDSEELTVSLKNLECLESKEEGTVLFHSNDEDEVGSMLNFHDKSVSLKAGDVVVIEFAADEE